MLEFIRGLPERYDDHMSALEERIGWGKTTVRMVLHVLLICAILSLMLWLIPVVLFTAVIVVALVAGVSAVIWAYRS